MAGFAAYFRRATGRAAYPYQVRLAELPIGNRILQVPTGAGKTAAAIVGWLYRRDQGDGPRRLVYCLPMRVLVEQTAEEARQWCQRVAPGVSVRVLMGGDVDTEWDVHPEAPAILVGTQDMLLSRALNRGYAMSRFRWPAHFGLLNNDAYWVCDEVQLMGDGLATTAQLAAFRTKVGTFGRCPTLWMSATLDREMLRTIDFEDVPDVLPLGDDDRQEASLRVRLEASKAVHAAPPECRTAAGLAAFLAGEHKAGTQTLVVVNRVPRAQAVFDEFRKVAAKIPCQLLHSRYRPHEKKEWHTILNEQVPDAGRVLISTQVVEAGVDISSALLVTDLAPWPSLVQRFGRCNRAGEHTDGARIYWIDRPLTGAMKDGALTDEMARPYHVSELEEAESRLGGLRSASPATLPDFRVPYRPDHVLRRSDLIDLFDTTPDLSGYDLDVSRFIRDENSRDVQVAWRAELPGGANREAAPSRDELCSVPIGDLAALLKTGKRSSQVEGVTWDALDGEWVPLRPDTTLRPGMVIVMASSSGCYDPERGWDPKGKTPVPAVPSPIPEEATGDDPGTFRYYAQSLEAHAREVRQQMRSILDSLGDLDLGDYVERLLEAALRHDWGKAHPVFQATVNPGGEGPLLAKTKGTGRHARKHFRHELASALAILQTGGDDLTAYLAGAHHGKVRLSIRALPGEAKPEQKGVRFARGIHDGDVLKAGRLGGIEVSEIRMDLEPMVLGRASGEQRSWVERMAGLRDRLGPFRLAFLESLIVASDIRASGDPQEVME